VRQADVDKHVSDRIANGEPRLRAPVLEAALGHDAAADRSGRW
jgi:hypothetical protein